MWQDTVIITRRVRHGLDLAADLEKAARVAEFAIGHKDERLTTRHVAHIGLNSTFSDMTLRRYGKRPPMTFRRERTKLEVAGSKVKPDLESHSVYIPAFRTALRVEFPRRFIRIREVVFDRDFAHFVFEVSADDRMEVQGWLGVDLNIIGPLAVVYVPTLGEVLRIGTEFYVLVKKYQKIIREVTDARKKGMRQRLYRRRKNRITDLLHKSTSKIVSLARDQQCGIRLEDLRGIRRAANPKRPQRIMVQQWPYFKFRQQIVYKAKMAGVPVQLVRPGGTSTTCAVHRVTGRRDGRTFLCPVGHEVDVDENAAMCISATVGKYEF